MTTCPQFSVDATTNSIPGGLTPNANGEAPLEVQGKYTRPDPEYIKKVARNNDFEDTDEFEDWSYFSFKNKERNLQAVMSLNKVQHSHTSSKRVYAMNSTIAEIAVRYKLTPVFPPPPSNQPAT